MKTKRAVCLLLLCLLLAGGLLGVGCASSAAEVPGGAFAVPADVVQAAREYAVDVSGRPGRPIGTLVISRIGLETAVLEGTDAATLEAGTGHWEETPVPGMGGRCVISGHRSTFGSLFLRLDELERGDSIEMRMPYGVFEYEVAESLIVEPDRVEVVRQRGLEELSLATCHPPGSGAYRLVVQARLIGYRPKP